MDWEPRARRVVAAFRAAMVSYSDDPKVRRLVDELSMKSTDVERCWPTMVRWRARAVNVRSSTRLWIAALPAGVAIPRQLAGVPADDVDRRKVSIAQTIEMSRGDVSAL